MGGPSRLGIHEQLPLDQAVLAHRKMEAGEVFGRIVLIPREASVLAGVAAGWIEA